MIEIIIEVSHISLTLDKESMNNYSEEDPIKILPFEWMRIMPTHKEIIDPIELESSLPDTPKGIIPKNFI